MQEADESHGIRVRLDHRIATVTIDRPPVNSVSFAAYESIRSTFEELGANERVSVVILTGAGTRAFCAGHDVREFVTLTPETADSNLPRVRAAFDAVQNCAVPVIAALNGPAVGAGLALASLSDVRLASTTASIALPEIDVGVLGSASHLMRLVPQGSARLLALTGRRITAEHALRLGFLEEVYPQEQLADAARALAEEIATKNPEAVRLMKYALNNLEDLPAAEGYELECTMTAKVRHGENAAEGARAFMENRNPRYQSV